MTSFQPEPNMPQGFYGEATAELKKLIPHNEYESVISQDMCELESDFLGFVEQYYALSKVIPKHYTVIDLGSYMAAQCYFFKGHKRYIGVDSYDIKEDYKNLKRFRTENTIHYKSTIQDFVKNMEEIDTETTFAICNYVPDKEAQDLVRETFENCFVFYPCGGETQKMRRKNL